MQEQPPEHNLMLRPPFFPQSLRATVTAWPSRDRSQLAQLQEAVHQRVETAVVHRSANPRRNAGIGNYDHGFLGVDQGQE